MGEGFYGDMVGLIPARGGSKRLPRKNIKMLAGKPLLAWTIEAALKSKLERVIVSTDDEEIALIARNWGADVPFMRPKELAKDATPSIDVIVHAVNWLALNEDYHPDYIMMLQATSPLRTSQDIDNCISLGKPVLSTTNGEWNGAIWVFGCNLVTYEIPIEHSIDINTVEDFELAELALRG